MIRMAGWFGLITWMLASPLMADEFRPFESANPQSELQRLFLAGKANDIVHLGDRTYTLLGSRMHREAGQSIVFPIEFQGAPAVIKIVSPSGMAANAVKQFVVGIGELGDAGVRTPNIYHHYIDSTGFAQYAVVERWRVEPNIDLSLYLVNRNQYTDQVRARLDHAYLDFCATLAPFAKIKDFGRNQVVLLQDQLEFGLLDAGEGHLRYDENNGDRNLPAQTVLDSILSSWQERGGDPEAVSLLELGVLRILERRLEIGGTPQVQEAIQNRINQLTTSTAAGAALESHGLLQRLCMLIGLKIR